MMNAPPKAVQSPEAFLDALFDEAILIRTGVDGLYGRAGVFEEVIDRFEDAVTKMAVGDQATRIHFPPGMPRKNLEKAGYLKSFPVAWVYESIPFAGECGESIHRAIVTKHIIARIVVPQTDEADTVKCRKHLAAILEFSQPGNTAFGKLYQFYLRRILPVIGAVLSGSRDAYIYLPESIGKFPTAEQLAVRMRETGFRTVEFTRMTGGTVALHIGGKSADAPLY